MAKKRWIISFHYIAIKGPYFAIFRTKITKITNFYKKRLVKDDCVARPAAAATAAAVAAIAALAAAAACSLAMDPAEEFLA
jgi:fatty acid desaturase